MGALYGWARHKKSNSQTPWILLKYYVLDLALLVLLLIPKATINLISNKCRAVRRWCNTGGQVVQLCNTRQRLINANSEAESSRLSMLACVFECGIHRRRCQEENIPVSIPISSWRAPIRLSEEGVSLRGNHFSLEFQFVQLKIQPDK